MSDSIWAQHVIDLLATGMLAIVLIWAMGEWWPHGRRR